MMHAILRALLANLLLTYQASLFLLNSGFSLATPFSLLFHLYHYENYYCMPTLPLI